MKNKLKSSHSRLLAILLTSSLCTGISGFMATKAYANTEHSLGTPVITAQLPSIPSPVPSSPSGVKIPGTGGLPGVGSGIGGGVPSLPGQSVPTPNIGGNGVLSNAQVLTQLGSSPKLLNTLGSNPQLLQLLLKNPQLLKLLLKVP